MNQDLPEALRVLQQLTGIFAELGVAYHVGGSFASSVHGIPRQTQDIDVVVDLRAELVPELCRRLQPDFYCDAVAVMDAIKTRGAVNLVHFRTALKVDIFVVGVEPFDQEEFRRHEVQMLDPSTDVRVCVKSAEDILLRKLQWFRLGGEVSDRQWGDVQGIVKIQGQRLNREYLLLWADRLGVRDLLLKVMPDKSD